MAPAAGLVLWPHRKLQGTCQEGASQGHKHFTHTPTPHSKEVRVDPGLHPEWKPVSHGRCSCVNTSWPTSLTQKAVDAPGDRGEQGPRTPVLLHTAHGVQVACEPLCAEGGTPPDPGWDPSCSISQGCPCREGRDRSPHLSPASSQPRLGWSRLTFTHGLNGPNPGTPSGSPFLASPQSRRLHPPWLVDSLLRPTGQCLPHRHSDSAKPKRPQRTHSTGEAGAKCFHPGSPTESALCFVWGGGEPTKGISRPQL